MSPVSSPGSPRVVVVKLHGPVTADQARRLYAHLEAHLDARDPVCVLCRVEGKVDLSVVDVLARIALIAGRRHTSVRVSSTCGDLEGLLTLTGLASVLPVETVCELEAAGQPEALEERGVEEVVDVGDLPA
jgi:ABC-type transporter Mla MlaB component